MTVRTRLHYMILTLVGAALWGLSGSAAAAPCDTYGSNGTPCVAAHSTTRAQLRIR